MKTRRRYARAERVVHAVLDALLNEHWLERYWFSIPCHQSDLKSSDLLRSGQVPLAVLERVSNALERK
jgi:hypothetical protein